MILVSLLFLGDFTGSQVVGNLNSRTGTSINIGSDLAGLGSLNNNRAKYIDSKLTATNFSVSNDKGLEISGFTVHSSTTNELEEQIDKVILLLMLLKTQVNFHYKRMN